MRLPTPQRILKNYLHYIKPHGGAADKQRQEYILNLLLSFILLLAIPASIISGLHYLSFGIIHHDNTLSITLSFTLVMAGLLALSRSGYQRTATYSFMGLLLLVSLQMLFQWGFMLPQVILLFALIIVIAGVLLSAKSGLQFAVSVSVVYLITTYLQVHGPLRPDMSWRYEPFYIGDAIGYIFVFMAIAAVSWLSTREIDASLLRARSSEADLAAERDGLEIKVIERTRELEAAQLIRLMELRRFAEFGQMSANLLHEVANPLTAASLNLELFDENQHSKLVSQARKNLQHLERYVQAARNQLKGESEITTFNIRSELSQIVRMVTAYAQKQDVTIAITVPAAVRLTGDAVKFNQIIGNLLLNAVDAYRGTSRPPGSKHIAIIVQSNPDSITCSIHDWGCGISKSSLSHIFEPFFTTKSDSSHNMGMGLAMVKQFVEHDFNGTITARSSNKTGTTFELMFRPRE